MTTAVFDTVAETYDVAFTETRLARLLRARIWHYLEESFAAGQRVLELGCGTGEDAVWLARRGISVLASDISPGMLAVAERKTRGLDVELARLDAADLSVRGSFDGGFANFGVLNCVPDLRGLAERLPIRSGGRFVAVVMGPFCAWETAWYLLHKDVARATRRWRSAPAEIGGAQLSVWYPSPHRLARTFQRRFALRSCAGLGTLLPPSYLSHLVERWPPVLARLDARMPFGQYWADHYVAVFERR
jgi:ubiquinone/menaquinone biosynthesis C-methylase UbiE